MTSVLSDYCEYTISGPLKLSDVSDCKRAPTSEVTLFSVDFLKLSEHSVGKRVAILLAEAMSISACVLVSRVPFFVDSWLDKADRAEAFHSKWNVTNDKFIIF